MSKLSFKTFCIEYYAEHTKQSSEKVYEIFKDTKLLDLLDSDYGDLHGMGMEYLMHLFRTNIELANWGRIIHQNEYRRLHRSHKDRLTLSAKERYEEFKRQFPHIYQRVQLGYVASYLGITLPTLSRLRAQK